MSGNRNIKTGAKSCWKVRRTPWKLLIASVTLFLLGGFVALKLLDNHPQNTNARTKSLKNATMPNFKEREIIFIGGFPGSGTTLLRVMLDCHPSLSCGPETRIIPSLLQLVEHYRSAAEMARLAEAGIDSQVLVDATSAFIRQILAKTQKESRTPCLKDPMLLQNSRLLAQAFPKSKFVLILRDGRAVAHSIIKRNILIKGIPRNMSALLSLWNRETANMLKQCHDLGQQQCFTVRYENVILATEETLKAVMQKLEKPWDDCILKHHNRIGLLDGPKMSRYEPSSLQASKPVRATSLQDWKRNFNITELSHFDEIAPLLTELGYTTH